MTMIAEIAGKRSINRFQGTAVGNSRRRVRRKRMPRAAYIPYARISRGEARTAIMQRRYELLSIIHHNRGDGYMSQQYTQAAIHLKGTLMSGLHNGFSDLQHNEMAASVNSLLRQTVGDRTPAIQPRTVAAIGTFQCDRPNLCKLKDKALDNRLRQEADKLTEQQLGYPRPSYPLGKNRGTYCDKFRENFCLLAERYIMEQIINEKLEGAGISLMYGLMGQDNNYKPVIAQKYANQENWFHTTANLTGLPVEDIRSIAENGYLASLEEAPNETKENIKIAMYQDFTQEEYDAAIGEPLTIAAVTAFIIIVKPLIVAAIGLIGGIINGIRAQKSEAAYAGIPNPASNAFAFEESDLLGEAKPKKEGSILQSNGLLLGLAALGIMLGGGLSE